MQIPAPFGVRREADVAWQPWDRTAFDEARARDRLVLLLLTMPWCATCEALETAEFRRPDVTALVRDHFVPVRVNAAARPDINERYVAGGWPTVVCLTAEGDPLIGGAPTDAQELVALLTRAARAFGRSPGALTARAAQRQPEQASWISSAGASMDPDRDAARDIVMLALDSYDPIHAGFGDGAKIPHAAVLRLLLGRAEADDRCRYVVASTLTAIHDWLRDPADGGFFRAARQRDWSDPDTAKCLEVQAELIELFAEAGHALGVARYLEAATGAIRFVDDRLAEKAGGYSIDGALYVDANALMARAYLRAGAVLRERRLTAAAVGALERVMVSAYRPGGGVAHEADAQCATRGLLTDHVHAAFALAESAAETGLVPHLMLAEELMLGAHRLLWDPAAGGLRDRAAAGGDVGLLRQPLRPFALNCDAARVWLRLAALAERPAYRDRAAETLASQRAFVEERGLFAAPYAIAAEELAGGARRGR